MRTLTILGSTGSIGTNTLDVVRQNTHRYSIFALVAGENTDLLVGQIREFRPKLAVTATPRGLERLRRRLGESGIPPREWPALDWGAAGRMAAAAASEADTVISAIVGLDVPEQ